MVTLVRSEAACEAGPVCTNLASYHPNMYTRDLYQDRSSLPFALDALQPEKEIGKYNKFLRERIQQVIRQR
jgi:hypothetical protein